MTDQPDSPGVPPASQAQDPRGCTATTRAGSPCRARPLEGRSECLWHSPDAESSRQAARSKGAHAANALRAIRGSRPRLDTTTKLVTYVSRLVYQVVGGEIDHGVARTIIYGLMLQRQLIEMSDIERRLSAIEARLGSSPQPVPPRSNSWLA